jgi:hypothetical protein
MRETMSNFRASIELEDVGMVMLLSVKPKRMCLRLWFSLRG